MQLKNNWLTRVKVFFCPFFCGCLLQQLSRCLCLSVPSVPHIFLIFLYNPVKLLHSVSLLFAQTLGQQLTQSQLSVDMFLCPPAHSSASTMDSSSYYPPAGGAPQGGPGGAPPRLPSASGGAAGGVGGAYCPSFDLASYASLAQFTSGELRYYPGFSRELYQQKLQAEVDRVLSRVTG